MAVTAEDLFVTDKYPQTGRRVILEDKEKSAFGWPWVDSAYETYCE